MLGVKITILLIVITVIYRFIVNAMVEQEDAKTKFEIAFNNKYPSYVWAFIILVIIDCIGVVYSVVWFLFLR